jgi:hypothetical protein
MFTFSRIAGGYLGGGGGARGGIHEAGHIYGYKDGGDLTPHIGEPVLVGEEGPEATVTPDGRASVVGAGGPERIVPLEPMTVVPNGSVSGLDFDRAREKRRLREEAARSPEKPAVPSVWWHDASAPVRVTVARRELKQSTVTKG